MIYGRNAVNAECAAGLVSNFIRMFHILWQPVYVLIKLQIAGFISETPTAGKLMRRETNCLTLIRLFFSTFRTEVLSLERSSLVSVILIFGLRVAPIFTFM